MKKGETAKDVYYTTERFNKKTEDIDLNIMTAQEKIDIYIAGAWTRMIKLLQESVQVHH